MSLYIVDIHGELEGDYEIIRKYEEPTTKNNLGVDCISRQAVIDLMMQKWGENFSGDDAMQESIDAIRELPSVTPQLSSGLEKNSKKLEKNFGELDCISRADAINAVSEALKHAFVEHEDIASKIIGKLPTITPQEPQTFKWCTDCREYDQEKHCCHRWSKVIRNTVEEMKQEYIEREVLDDLRAEVETEKLEDLPNFCIKAHNIAIDRVLGIIDKYKAEAEG